MVSAGGAGAGIGEGGVEVGEGAVRVADLEPGLVAAVVVYVIVVVGVQLVPLVMGWGWR